MSHLIQRNKPLESVLANYDESKVHSYKEVVYSISRFTVYQQIQSNRN